MDNKEEIIDEICSYAEKHQIKELLHEYMKRVIVNQPKNVKEFLIETIEKNPFTPAPKT